MASPHEPEVGRDSLRRAASSARAGWRFYVRYARSGGGDLNANVPARFGDAPLSVTIATADLSFFPLSKRANPASYPRFTSVVELKWAAREP